MLITINKKCIHKPPQTGEAGFTLIEMVIVIVLSSILGIFVLGILTKCLVAQRDMQVRKEMSDEAIMTMEKMNRELKEANFIQMVGANRLVFIKNITSSVVDTNLNVAYVLDPDTNTLFRQSAATLGGLTWTGPPDFISPSGTAIATNVNFFDSTETSGRIAVGLGFVGGSNWQTRIFPRNNNL